MKSANTLSSRRVKLSSTWNHVSSKDSLSMLETALAFPSSSVAIAKTCTRVDLVWFDEASPGKPESVLLRVLAFIKDEFKVASAENNGINFTVSVFEADAFASCLALAFVFFNQVEFLAPALGAAHRPFLQAP